MPCSPRHRAASSQPHRLASTSPSCSQGASPTRSRPPFGVALHRRRQAASQVSFFPGLTYLESIAVREPTRLVYQKLWGEFMAPAERFGWLPLRLSAIDCHLAEILDEWFFEGRTVDEAAKLISAAKHVLPALRRVGGSQTLPRTDRALRAWRKTAPVRQRVPLPWLAMAAMVCYVSDIFAQPHLGAKCLVAFHTYLRPVEMDNLLVHQLVPPCPVQNGGPTGCGAS